MSGSSAWIKASTNVSNRDKALRVFQYSSVMLLAYYKDSLSKESTNMLQNIRSSASISRRGFRLLKSLNHIANIATIVEHMLSDNCKNVVESMFSMIYEASLAALYYYDNYVFLSRLGIFTHTEKENKEFYKKSLISWCVGECFKFASILYKHQLQWKELKMLRAEQKVRTSTTAEACLQEEVQRLESEISAHYFQYIKALCNVTLSASLIDDTAVVRVMGRRAYDITVGFLGATTAAISLYENNFT